MKPISAGRIRMAAAFAALSMLPVSHASAQIGICLYTDYDEAGNTVIGARCFDSAEAACAYGYTSHCKNLSPEQIAKGKTAAAAKDAIRQAETRKRAEFKRDVDAEVARMGEHRRAEAERLVRMRQAAEAARPKPQQTAQQDRPASPPSPRNNCGTVPVTGSAFALDADEGAAIATAQRRADNACRGWGVAVSQAPVCTMRSPYAGAAAPKGKKGEQWAYCNVAYRCTIERPRACEAGKGRAQ